MGITIFRKIVVFTSIQSDGEIYGVKVSNQSTEYELLCIHIIKLVGVTSTEVIKNQLIIAIRYTFIFVLNRRKSCCFFIFLTKNETKNGNVSIAFIRIFGTFTVTKIERLDDKKNA